MEINVFLYPSTKRNGFRVKQNKTKNATKKRDLRAKEKIYNFANLLFSIDKEINVSP